MFFKVCQVVNVHILIQVRKELVLDERSLKALNLFNLIY